MNEGKKNRKGRQERGDHLNPRETRSSPTLPAMNALREKRRNERCRELNREKGSARVRIGTATKEGTSGKGGGHPFNLILEEKKKKKRIPVASLPANYIMSGLRGTSKPAATFLIRLKEVKRKKKASPDPRGQNGNVGGGLRKGGKKYKKKNRMLQRRGKVQKKSQARIQSRRHECMKVQGKKEDH